MQIEYSPDADVLIIRLRVGTPCDAHDLCEGIIIHYDETLNPLEIEILDASKIIPIGNSQGILISKPLIQKYGFIDHLVLEKTDRGILLRKPDKEKQWEHAFQALKKKKEDWRDLDVTLMDGLSNDDA